MLYMNLANIMNRKITISIKFLMHAPWELPHKIKSLFYFFHFQGQLHSKWQRKSTKVLLLFYFSKPVLPNFYKATLTGNFKIWVFHLHLTAITVNNWLQWSTHYSIVNKLGFENSMPKKLNPNPLITLLQH